MRKKLLKIKELIPGMLLKPIDGFVWEVVPWKGSSGDVVGNFLRVCSERYQVDDNITTRSEGVLYLGTSDSTSTLPTPGRQVVLAWGKKMTIDPSSWRNITLNL